MKEFNEPELTYAEFKASRKKIDEAKEELIFDNYDTDGSSEVVSKSSTKPSNTSDDDYEDYTYNQ